MNIKLLLNLLKNMKVKYVTFRVYHWLKIKTGVLKKQFPVNVPFKNNISREEWIRLKIPYFTDLLYNKRFDINDKERLKYRADKIFTNEFKFFSSIEYDLGNDYDWTTNPDTGYRYNIYKHWSEIEDISQEAGDIKYVWEKARFTFIYDIIRYDHYFNKDSSAFILGQIEDFIDKNPINQGPNYKCSQEISIRVLNWAFAINYYKNSKNLTNDIFENIINSIYWQLDHVYKNINFSRIAVRNNHAITETSMLYLSGLLFPFIPETKKWSEHGKKWLLEEIDYQIYDDGSYLQFSHNYHRVIVQTLTYVLKINQINGISFDKVVNNKLVKTLKFLFNHQDVITGKLPNYGNNDGALFFPLNNNDYRDFRPQLQAFGLLLGIKLYEETFEDAYWYGLENEGELLNRESVISHNTGGFFGFRDESLTTIRCGKYKDRPSQADALNLDIWHNGINYLFDPGTYKYNTEDKYIKFYNGTAGHNTLTIGNYDQMLKGGRFIWYYWTKYAKAKVNEFEDRFEFYGKINGFPLLGNNINHIRTVIKYKNELMWEVIDKTNYKGDLPVKLHWNINPDALKDVIISHTDIEGNDLSVDYCNAWYSELYGVKKEFNQLTCVFDGSYCKTIIKIK